MDPRGEARRGAGAGALSKKMADGQGVHSYPLVGARRGGAPRAQLA